MRLFLLVVFWLEVFACLAYIHDLLTKTFPYAKTETAAKNFTCLLMVIGIGAWAAILLWRHSNPEPLPVHGFVSAYENETNLPGYITAWQDGTITTNSPHEFSVDINLVRKQGARTIVGVRSDGVLVAKTVK